MSRKAFPAKVGTGFASGNATKRKLLRLALGVAVSGLFVWLVLRAVSWAEIVSVLAEARPLWGAAAVALFALGYTARIWRWRSMLAGENAALGWSRCMVPFMASMAANNLLPFRAGDALRAFAFSRWLGVPNASILATLLAERLLDLLTVLLALGLALWLVSSEPVLGASAALLLGLAGLGLLGLLAPGLFEPPLRWLCTRLPSRVSETALAQLDRLFSTLKRLAAAPWPLIALSLIAWACEAGVFYAAARALPALTEPIAAWLAMPVGTLSTLLPSTPGYVGTFHFAVLRAAEVMGNEAAAAGAFAVLVHLALWGPATLWGGAAFLYWQWRGAA